MCGIAGFLDLSRSLAADDLAALATAMASSLTHRGPDDDGVWVDPEAGVAFGHRRLSIIDLSAEGHQPMVSADGRYVVSYNGEIYNFLELRKHLETRGHAFRGHSDTEVMLAAASEWGFEEAVERLNGMFAMAVWDRRERRLWLARDRLGEKPLYYGWAGSAFLFASELKALHRHPAFRPAIDRASLALFLRYGYVPSPHSIYEGIRKLSPGCLLAVDAGNTSARPPERAYWSVRDAAEGGVREPLDLADPADAADELDALLRDAVAMRMVADVPLGAFLSGGVDSSTTVALMQAQSTQPVRTFTIGFHEAGYNEAEHAKAVARHLGTEHTEFYVTPQDAIEIIPRLPDFYDEPFADSSQIPTFLVSRLTREHVTVALSGDGGDELFMGYDRYQWVRRLWRLHHLPVPVRRTVARTLSSFGTDGWDRTAGRALGRGRLGERLHKAAGLLEMRDPLDLFVHAMTHWRDADDVVLDAPLRLTRLTDPAGRADLPRLMDQLSYLDTVTYLPDDILTKVDRATMAVSLEGRIPLLDHRVVEFAWRLPPSLKVRRRKGKWLLRQVLYRYVPKDLVERPKMGFAMPVGGWLRGPLRDWAEELLSERRLRDEGYFAPDPIRTTWEEHLAGRGATHHRLWDVLMFQAWLEQMAPVSGR